MDDNQRQIVLDTDVGIDDALMILYLAAQPNAEIVAAGSTHGNVDAHTAALNTLRVFDLLGLDHVPVAAGAESPLPNAIHSAHVHGRDGLADVGFPPPRRSVSDESAVDQLLRLSNERPGELDLLAVGAMTNLGLALERDPGSLKRFRSVTILGGISHRPGPDAPVYHDANVFHNPEAADRLLRSGTPLTVVPIDLSYLAALEDRHLDAIQHGTTPQARFAWQILPCYCAFYQDRLGRWSACMHDPIAAGIFLDPSLVRAEVLRPVIVEPWEGRHRAVGLTGPAPDGRAPVRIITGADIPRFLDRFVEALLTPLAARNT